MTDENNTMFANFNSLHQLTSNVKKDICGKVGKKDFSEVTKADMCIRGKVPLEFLSKTMISLINCVEDCINPIVKNDSFIYEAIYLQYFTCKKRMYKCMHVCTYIHT